MIRLLVYMSFLVLLTGYSTKSFQQKILILTVNAKGQVSIDRIAIETEDLPRELQQRLWRSYMSNGKMPESISLQFESTLPEEIVKIITDAVKLGQQRTLNILSLHKHKNKFENIGSRKQEKIKKHFPVLFQQDLIRS